MIKFRTLAYRITVFQLNKVIITPKIVPLIDLEIVALGDLFLGYCNTFQSMINLLAVSHMID